MSSSGADAGLFAQRFQAEVGVGARFVLTLPAGAREVPEGELPALNVAGLPGVSVALRRGFRVVFGNDGGSIFVGCVRGPSDKWAPGIEELVLGRATAIARGSIGADLERIEARPIRSEKLVIDQHLSGEGTRFTDKKPALIEVRHLLAFAGEAREGVLCSVACVEPRSEGLRCAEIVATASLEGALVEPPPPSLLVRLILAAAERPLHAGVLVAALGIALVALVLARRPRPRPL